MADSFSSFNRATWRAAKVPPLFFIAALVMRLPDGFEFGQPMLEALAGLELVTEVQIDTGAGAGNADGEGDL
jgi:hypothetical protein